MRVAVLGCGNMGKAIMNGLLEKYGTDCTVHAWDKIPAARESVPEKVLLAEPAEWFSSKSIPHLVLIAVKPQDIFSALKDVKDAKKKLEQSPLWCSIAAGITIASLASVLGENAKICRVMPNTPALIGQGISAYACNNNCADDDKKVIDSVLTACGSTIAVDETMLNAVTGLSGSGPAYVYLFIESLVEGGVAAGLPYQTALELAVKTVIGGAKMVEKTGEHTAVLKSRVMSPGGTTAAGLSALEAGKFKSIIMDAVKAAASRSGELAS